MTYITLLSASILMALSCDKTPEPALKAERFELTLSEHCRKLGFSAGYARRVFARRFLIEPQEYRLRRRLERILYLLSTHRYCHKEIADMVGMKSVNHLHSFLKQRSGMTPGEIDKKFPV